MSVLSSRVWPGWAVVVVAVGLAGLAHGAERGEAPASDVPPHSLVVAAETLYLQGLPQACDELLKLASIAPGLTDDDLIRVHFLAAMRDLDEQNDLGARRALSQALQLDREATPPPSSSAQLRMLLEEVRSQLSPGPPAKSTQSRLETARKAASAREPAAPVLLRAVDALYANLQVEGAGIILEMALTSIPLIAADRTQFVLRRGILAMESGHENEARSAFRESLGADPKVVFPDYTPPKTRGIFEEVKRDISPPATTAAPPPALPKQAVAATTAAPSPPAGPASGRPPGQPKVPATTAPEPSLVGKPMANSSRTWGLAVGGGGAALVVGGAVAGFLALSAYEAEKDASSNGVWVDYIRNRDTAGTAVIAANALYAAGAVALGVGAYLFLNAPGHVQVGAGAGNGNVAFAVGGSF